ncbi:type II toxin-antitoxin system MqsA family antitoxin [Methylobacterium sp. 10]|uniref:helix-turn-helix domain-containing protein n=1 Tax=Methylobacterium sp. 10 TaxID=1101191 RepID=UPI0004B20A40|nr:type II toxin-antitoxin system MqsA family antitoxin [Methylobacterium sp. 10]
MASERRVSDGGQRIVDGLDDAIAWAKGNEGSARLIPWQAPTSVDVKAIRAKLGMSQREFAACFGLPLESLRNWEQDKRVPQTTALVLLRLIDNDPEYVRRALAI